MTNLYKLEDRITNPKRFFRSIRLESDIGNISMLSGYTLTNHVLHVLGRIEEGLHENNVERAWTLTGPYGSGKSAFALFLANLLTMETHENSNIAYSLLQDRDPQLASHYKTHIEGRGFCHIALTLQRAPLSQSILEGLLQSLYDERQTNNIKKLISDIKGDLLNGKLSSELIIDRINSFNDVLSKKYRGSILILDELGKALEFASRHSGEDVYLLQELAEHASRSKNITFILVGILHQAFEQYGEYLDQTSRQEWAKVQGRFSDIAFIEPPEQQIRLTVQAISSLNFKIEPSFKISIADVANIIFENGFIPKGLKQVETESLAINAYPLHFSVLTALPILFKRFAQNQRSLFAYLLSNEPFGLQELQASDNKKIIRLPDLFDYFSVNVSGNISKQMNSRRWYEITETLERVPDLSLEEINILKTIGLLDLLGDTGYMPSNYEFISLALCDELFNNTVYECLSSLQKKSLIVFRRYNQTYKIWEGSDIDIEARLEKGQQKNRDFSLAEDLQRFLPKQPMVARKHSHEVGTLRFFEIRYTDSIAQTKQIQPTKGLDGAIICCLPSSQEQVDILEEWVKNEDISSLNNVLIVIPQHIRSLQDAASELRAIHWVWQNTPELRDDRIARRELSERTTFFEQLLRKEVQQLLDPRSEPLGSGATWYHMGQKQEVENLRGISELLSKVMDNVYSKSPRIKNELINKRIISAAASAARRKIVERMLLNANESSLGIEGFPPEKSIYESVLNVSGLHQENKPYWRIPTEEEDSLNLLPTFRCMEKKIFSALEEPYSLECLLQELAMPPYGIMPGVFPIILAAFMLSYSDEISLYREDVFIPLPNIADFEVLMRRPELFAVAGSRLQGERLIVVERISEKLRVQPTTLAVTRSIMNMVRQLPDHAWRTRKLSKPVINLRTVIEQAKSPERLIFIDIPKALEEPPFMDGTAEGQERIERFFKKLNHALQEWSSITEERISEAGGHLLKACNMPSGAQGWQELIELAHQLEEKPLADLLKPFIKRLIMQNDLETVIESVLALVANRPPRSWTDQEVECFPSLAQQIGDKFILATQQFKVLSPSEEQICNELIDKIKHQIGDDISPHIKETALARLLREQE